MRTSGNGASLPAAVRQIIRQIDAKMTLYDMKTMRVQLEEHVYRERLIAILSSAFGLLATLLAAIGLYGVIAYSVARRTAEIGIRVALGVQRGNVIWLVMREVALVILIGVSAGSIVAVGLGRTVESQLFGLRGNDPLTFAAASCTLLLIAAAAGYIPALRAARIDPTRALRYE